MDYQSFKNEWQGRRVDFTRDGRYTADDLISEYLWSTQDIKFELNGVGLASLYEHVPDDLTATLYGVQDPVVKEGDICFLQGFNHWGIATGEQDVNRFEMLEQNAVGSNSGIGDDAIRVNYYGKEQLYGLWRMRVQAVNKPSLAPVVEALVEDNAEKIQAVVLELEPKVAKKYRAPVGALRVPLATQRILIKVELDTYPTSGLAEKRDKPTGKLVRPGMQEFDLLQNGMLRVAGTTLWINPADNVPRPIRPPQAEYKPQLDGAKEAEENFVNFHINDDPNAPLEERPYLAKSSGAYVTEFATGKSQTMPAGARVWLAGYTKVGEMGYGIATKCLEDSEGRPLPKPRWIGISLGQLKPDDAFNTETSVQDRKALRTLKPQDYLTLGKAKIQKRIMDVRRKV